MRAKRSTRSKAIAAGYRSGLEEKIALQLADAGVAYGYENCTVKYTKPASEHKYTPDFSLSNGVVIETKGRFTKSDRDKHLLIKDQRPELDIRFVFSNSRAKLYKGSKTTYGDWATKHGFQWADKEIPKEWLTVKT